MKQKIFEILLILGPYNLGSAHNLHKVLDLHEFR